MPTIPWKGRRILRDVIPLLAVAGALVMLTWGAHLAQARAGPAAILFASLVVLVSLRSGLAPSLLAAIGSVAMWDLFFTGAEVSPADRTVRDLLALVAFSAIAVMVNHLASALRRSEYRWRNVFENNPTMYFIVDASSTVLSVNPFGAEQLGYTVPELTGESVLKIIDDEDTMAAREHVSRSLAHVGTSMSWEIRKRRKDGTMLWVRETARAVQLGSEAPVVLIACEDITKQRAAQEKLRRSEADLRWQASLLDLTHDAIFVRDLHDTLVYWNRGAEELYGWTSEEVLGRASHDLTQTIFPVAHEEIRATLLQTGRWDGELVHTKRDGTRIVVASRWSLQRDAAGQPAGVMVTNSDVTERVQALRDLQESARRYQNIFQTAAVSIWEEDFSQVTAAIDELRAGGVRDFRSYFAEHPDFVARAVQMVRVVDVNEATVALFGARSKTELLDSLTTVFTPDTLPLFAEELLAVAERRSSFAAEARLQTVHGEQLEVLFTMAFPPEPMTLDSVLVSIMDISGRRRAEEALQRARADLARVGALTTMGELAASIAHELRQPLAAITMNGCAAQRWLNRESPDLGEARDAVARVVREAQRADEVIRGLRSLLGQSGARREALDLNAAISEVLELVRTELRRNEVSIRTVLDAELPAAFGDRVQFQQVVLNLILNGSEAMASVAGRPRILVIRTERTESEAVAVIVEDTGPGLDPATVERVFDPFFTTKPNGLGLGLSICRSIVEAHGGRLSASARASGGSTFRFTVPIAPQDAPAQPTSERQAYA
jgi:PAS domain S-box-containing protein